jgi:hypothetical protein
MRINGSRIIIGLIVMLFIVAGNFFAAPSARGMDQQPAGAAYQKPIMVLCTAYDTLSDGGYVQGATWYREAIVDRFLDVYVPGLYELFYLDVEDTLTMDDLEGRQLVIIAPFIDSLKTLQGQGFEDYQQNLVARACDSLGIGIMNWDPYTWGWTDSLKSMIPIYYNSTKLTINLGVTYRGGWRENFGAYCNTKDILNDEYPTLFLHHQQNTSQIEDYYLCKIDSLGGRLIPLLIGTPNGTDEYPMIAQGISPSGRGNVWTVTAPPTYLLSDSIGTYAKWTGYRGRNNDLFWTGLSWCAKSGIAMKGVKPQLAVEWDDAYGPQEYQGAEDSYEWEFLDLMQGLGGPLTFLAYIGAPAFEADTIEAWKRFIARGGRIIPHSRHYYNLLWVDDDGGAPPNLFPYTERRFYEETVDTINLFHAATGAKFSEYFLGHGFHSGTGVNGCVYSYLKNNKKYATNSYYCWMNFNGNDTSGGGSYPVEKDSFYIEYAPPFWTQQWDDHANYHFSASHRDLPSRMIQTWYDTLGGENHCFINTGAGPPYEYLFLNENGVPQDSVPTTMDSVLMRMARSLSYGTGSGIIKKTFIVHNHVHIITKLQGISGGEFEDKPGNVITAALWERFTNYMKHYGITYIRVEEAAAVNASTWLYSFHYFEQDGNRYRIVFDGPTWGESEFRLTHKVAGGVIKEFFFTLPKFDDRLEVNIEIDEHGGECRARMY